MKNNSLGSLLTQLAEYASKNRLVLFLGAGFSRAVMGYDQNVTNHFSCEKAKDVPSWFDLVKLCREDLSLKKCDYSKEMSIDCPVEASKIITELMDKGHSRETAENTLKATICKLTDFYPNPEQVCAFQKLFADIKPSLIITTNYDGVVETILHRAYYSYGPKDLIERLPDNMISVYHLHGTRNLPKSIVITREDYVEALRPFTYRQQKLACILREHAVVYIGYRRNDINVLSAIDCAYNTFSDIKKKLNPHIQLIYTDGKNSENAVCESNEQYSVEYADTFDFLQRLSNECKNVHEQVKKENDRIEKTRLALLGMKDEVANNVLKRKRGQLSKLLTNVGRYISGDNLTSSYNHGNLIVMVQELYAAARSQSCIAGNFEAYDDCLFIVIQLLKNIGSTNIGSFLFDFAAKKLEEISPYIGPNLGQSYQAFATIQKEWKSIPVYIRDAIADAARRYERNGTKDLIARLAND